MADTFLNTTVFQTIEYTEIKAVCVTTISARPDANNVNTLVKAYTPENLANLSLVELEKKGGPDEGSFLVEGHEVKYGISYARDDEGNLLMDDDGQLIINENNGILFGLAVGEALKKVTFNAIIVYGTEINAETNAPVIATVSMFNNSLSFEKILNFFTRYIITIDKELIELKFDYVDVYGKHEKETNSSTFYMKEQHPQILERVMLSSQGDVQTDELTQLQKQYELFIKDRDDYLYIRPLKDNKFDDDLLSTSIQAHQNARLYKYEDSTIKTPYLYFYYNLIATRRIILQGIKAATDNTEDAGAVEAITVEQLRKHIKIGFSETMGPFLYTWFSTTKFIYVICYGSNSNNNVDIYRVRNRGGYDINDVNYNLIVGKYLDRIYFTIEGDLHVCVPQVKTKTTESEIENDRFREEAKKTLTFHDFLYVDFDAMTDSEIEDAYKVVWDDINATNSATYLLSKEQLYILILSKNEEYKKFVTDGQFAYPADEPYTGDSKPVTANEFFEQGLFQPDADGKSTIKIQDKKAVYQYLKYPIDRVNNFIAYIDKVTKECIAYKDDYGSESYKTPYVNQVSIALIERMRPDYLTDQNYAINWWGQNKQSGAKYSALLWTLKNGKEDNPQPSKYEDYIEYYLTEGNEGNIIDIILNAGFREKVETELPVASDTFNVYMSGIVERLTTKDPTYTVDNVIVGYQEYFFKAIYKENDIIATESELLRFYQYSLYRALYDNVVSSSKSYQQYVLREYLVNEEKAGANNGDLIDKLNSMSIVEIDAYFDENKLSPLTNSMNDGAWWSDTVLEQLEKLYLGVIETPLSITYAFGYKDDCYYNGEEQKDVSIVKRDADIPYRYGFPLPNYIYNSQTSDIFIIPAKENVDIAGEYKSLTQMKEDLMIAQKDGEANSKAELDKLTTLTADVEVDTDADIFSLSTVTGTITEQDKEHFDNIDVYASSTDAFPSVGEADKYYYSSMDNSVYKYEGIGYQKVSSYPSNGNIYQVGGLYYKVATKEQQVDYSVKVNNNEFTASNKTYKLKLLNITKTDTTENVDTTDNSTGDKIEYTFTPPVANKDYTLSFMSITPTEGDVLTIIVKQGTNQLINQKIGDKTSFEITPTSEDEITVTIDKATTNNMSVQYITSGNKRKLTITETITSFDPDVEDTVNKLLEEELDFSGGNIDEKVVEVTATNGIVNISLENGIIASVKATYQDTLNKIEKWEEYTLPTAGTIAQAKDTKSYYKYDGVTWTTITLQEVRNEYTNKIYFVKDEDKYYRFGGMNWVAITPVYNIKKGNIYRITNENETINGEITPTKTDDRWILTGIRSNQLYDISLKGISMIDDREIVNVPVDINIDKYTFVPIDINIEYPIQITGINGNGKIILKKAEKVSTVAVKEKTANTEYTFTPPVSKKEYTVTITPLTQEADAKVSVDTQEQPINDLTSLTIKITPTNKNAITIKATNATISEPIIEYVEQEEQQISEQEITDITEVEIKYTPADKDKIIIEPQGITCNTPTITYIKNENSGLRRTILIKQGTEVLKSEEISFATTDETFDKEYQVTSKDETDITIEVGKTNIDDITATFSYIRKPDGAGLEYYIWNGASFEKTAVQIIPPQNSCKWYIDDLTVYFNIFIEGDKLSVIRDLFKGPDGEILKVVQFDFSDIGDVVLVRDYNKQGQNCWGGVFSRYSTSTEVDTTKKIYNYGSVMSDNFMDCFNWDAYNYIAFTFRADGSAYISDERIKAIQATYEVSRSHFEVLQHKFGDNMYFSNALTIAWEKSDETNYSHTMFVYPKNIKMFPNMMTMPYNGIRFLVNNYFIIEGNSWFDIIYNRCYKMNTGIQPHYYQNRFLSAMRSLVVVSVSDHDDESGLNGAVSYFNCNNWYDKTQVTDYIEKINIPQKDI